jgi:PAS domain-containing protein
LGKCLELNHILKGKKMKHAGKTKAQLISELDEVSQGLGKDSLKEALEQKISELHSFLNNIPDMAWVKDIESRFIAVNKAFGDAVEMDPESLINQTCEVCFGEEGEASSRKMTGK